MRAGERVSRPTTHASRVEVADFRSKLRNNTGASAERTPSMRSPAHGIRRRPDPSRIIRRALLPVRARSPWFATQRPTGSTKQTGRVAASAPESRKKNRPTSDTSLRSRALGGRVARETRAVRCRLAEAPRRCRDSIGSRWLSAWPCGRVRDPGATLRRRISTTKRARIA